MLLLKGYLPHFGNAPIATVISVTISLWNGLVHIYNFDQRELVGHLHLSHLADSLVGKTNPHLHEGTHPFALLSQGMQLIDLGDDGAAFEREG